MIIRFSFFVCWFFFFCFSFLYLKWTLFTQSTIHISGHNNRNEHRIALISQGFSNDSSSQNEANKIQRVKWKTNKSNEKNKNKNGTFDRFRMVEHFYCPLLRIVWAILLMNFQYLLFFPQSVKRYDRKMFNAMKNISNAASNQTHLCWKH